MQPKLSMTDTLRKHWLFLCFIVPLTLLLLFAAIYSLNWRNQLDVPYMLYMVNLMDHHGFVPYRDILFDANMPGAYFLYWVFARLAGYPNDFGFRLIDLTWLTAILAVTGVGLRQFGWKVVWAASVMFGLVYLSSSHLIILQREYLAVLPIAASITLAVVRFPADRRLRAVLSALGIGIAATIKPHLGIGIPVIVVFLCLDEYPAQPLDRTTLKGWLSILGWTMLGLAIPLAAVAIYLARLGALADFYQMFTDFVPLYSTITYSNDLAAHTVMGPAERPLFVLKNFLLFGEISPVWFVAAFAGFVATYLNPVNSPAARRRVALLAGLAAAYGLYPTISGQFWAYHWIPFSFLLVVLASLCFQDLSNAAQPILGRAVVAVAAAALFFDFDAIPTITRKLADFYLNHEPLPPADEGIPDRVEAFLRANLQPGDTVQNLEWIGGIAHGMLRADAEPPRPTYVIDVPFYVNIEGSRVDVLRERFIGQLNASLPRFIIARGDSLPIVGDTVNPKFNELQLLMNAHYHLVESGDGLMIYERNPGWSANTRWTVAVHPFRPSDIAVWFTNQTDLLYKAIPDGSTPDDLRSTIRELAGEPQVVTLVYANEDRSDSDRTLESEAADNLFRVSEYQSKLARVAEYLSLPTGCSVTSPSDIAFGTIAVKSQAAQLVTLGDDRAVCVRLEWVASQRVANSYKVAAHIIGPDGTLVAQYDAIPRGYLAPTTGWNPDQSVIDQFAIHLPATLPPGDYRVQLVLYDEATGERLTVTGGSPDQDYALLATFQIDSP